MDILVLILAAFCLWGIKISYKGHPDYISRAQTDSIKGIFAIIILFSHMRGYIPPESGEHDSLFFGLSQFLGQLMVVMFLLYSGYGIMESLKRDRQRYTDRFLTHRLLKTWLMFAIAVALYLILSLTLGVRYDAEKYLWCWIGWESIGNSNWFVFDILALYLLTYIGLIIANRLSLNLHRVVLIVYALTLVFLVALMALGKSWYWYDTILAYPTGMLYSVYKSKIEQTVSGRKWPFVFVSALALFIVLYMSIYLIPAEGSSMLKMIRFGFYLCSTSAFAIVIVLLTMKLKISNPALQWLGVNAFAIYILQRLAMIICAHFGLNDDSLLFSAIVIPSTLLVAAAYTASTNRLNRLLFK